MSVIIRRVVPPHVLAQELERTSASAPIHRPEGSGRRMRRLARTSMVFIQILMLVFMVMAPAALLAAKPTSTGPSANAQTTTKGNSADAKGKAKDDATKP